MRRTALVLAGAAAAAALAVGIPGAVGATVRDNGAAGAPAAPVGTLAQDEIGIRVEIPAGPGGVSTPATVTVRSTATRTATLIVENTGQSVSESSATPATATVAAGGDGIEQPSADPGSAAPVAPPDTGGSGGLAFTGAPLVVLGGLALLVVAAGVVAVLLGRRRTAPRA